MELTAGRHIDYDRVSGTERISCRRPANDYNRRQSEGIGIADRISPDIFLNARATFRRESPVRTIGIKAKPVTPTVKVTRN